MLHFASLISRIILFYKPISMYQIGPILDSRILNIIQNVIWYIITKSIKVESHLRETFLKIGRGNEIGGSIRYYLFLSK